VGEVSIYMKYYRSTLQKSSNPPHSSLKVNYGLSPSVAAWGIKGGMAAHLRIYEAALRVGLEHMHLSAKELIAWLGEHEIAISMATAHRALTDVRFFRLVTVRKNGKKGRPPKIYALVKPDKIGDMLGLPLGVISDAPELAAVDLSTTLNYKLALLGRYMMFNEYSTRKQQMEFWEWSKPTMIRWTREVCEITPQYNRRLRSDNLDYTVPINGEDYFLYHVQQREGDRRFWLEVIDRDGVILKLPCLRDIAKQWLSYSVITICEQLPNHYRVHAAYRDTPLWERGELLPY
jgi:hypothetical protein